MWRSNSYAGPAPLDNDEVVDRLKKIMIRHTKSQRIGGQVALSLPETDHATVWLDMSDDEALTPRPSPPAPSPLAPHPLPLTPRPSPLTLTSHRRSSTTCTGAKITVYICAVKASPSSSRIAAWHALTFTT